MNKYEIISNVIQTLLGVNIGVLVLGFFSIPEDLLLFFKVILYLLGIISFIITIYYKNKSGKLEIENKKLKQEQEQREKDGVFIFKADYTEKE